MFFLKKITEWLNNRKKIEQQRKNNPEECSAHGANCMCADCAPFSEHPQGCQCYFCVPYR